MGERKENSTEEERGRNESMDGIDKRMARGREGG